MVSTRLCFAWLLAAALSSPSTLVMAGTADGTHQAAVEARVPHPPQPVLASDGHLHAAYEIHVTNFYADTGPLRLERLVVFGDDASRPLLDVGGPALRGLLAQAPGADKGVVVEGGKRITLFVWLELPADRPTRSLRHQLDFETRDGQHQRASRVIVPVDNAKTIVLAAPLRGRWLANEGPGNNFSHHWGSVVAIDGQVTIPQRFAADWFGLDARFRSTRIAAGALATSTDADWVGFGADVLAVKDGVVRDVHDGSPDGTPLAALETPVDLTNRSLYGNFVVLEIAPGIFAHYAHLKNGSVKVKNGDRVRRGDVIAAVGQTGSAGAPHLHFHVSDAPSFEGSEGLPFVFDEFGVHGKLKVEDSFGDSTAGAPERSASRSMAMPLDGDVVEFVAPR